MVTITKEIDKLKKLIQDMEKQEALNNMPPPPNPREKVYKADYKTGTLKYINMTDQKGFWASMMYKFNMATKGHRAMLINMELANGDHTHFVTFIDDGKFEYHQKMYIVDDSIKYYNISSKMWCADYHEDISFPIRRKIDSEKLKKAMTATGVSDIDMAFNPTTLKLFIESQVIQKVIKGADLDKVMEFIKRMLIIILIVVLILLGLFVQASGMLKNIHLPGMK